MNAESRSEDRLPQLPKMETSSGPRCSCEDFRLALRHAGRGRLEFEARLGDTRRAVSVLVRPDATVEFPHLVSDGGLSLGDSQFDQEVVERAQEVLALRGRRLYRGRRR